MAHKLKSIPGVVYVVQDVEDGPGPCKIGSVSNEEAKYRLNSIQGSNWRKLRKALVISCQDRRKIEHLLHATFADRRIRGGWFKIQPEDVVAVVDLLKQADGNIPP